MDTGAIEKLRIALNPSSGKELVVLIRRGESFVQIVKWGELEEEFSVTEIEDFITDRRGVCQRICQFLDDIPIFATSERLLEHVLTFYKTRDKPFVRFERDGCFAEVGGVPVFRFATLGLTSWSVICNEKDRILEALYAGKTTNYTQPQE